MMRMQLIIMLFLVHFNDHSESLWELIFHNNRQFTMRECLIREKEEKKLHNYSSNSMQSLSNRMEEVFFYIIQRMNVGIFRYLSRFIYMKSLLKCRSTDTFLSDCTSHDVRTDKINVNCSSMNTSMNASMM